MEIANILNFGIFDSKKLHPATVESADREVEFFEFDYILSCDKASVSYIGIQSQNLFPGLLILRKPGDISHSMFHYKCYALHVNLRKDSSLYRDLMSFPSYFLITDIESYQNIFSEMFRHLVKSKENLNSYYAYSKFLELIHYMKKDASKTQNSIASSKKKEAISVKIATEYMKNNFCQNISLQTLGKITGYSPNHLRSVFSDTMNMSPQKYLEKIRIDNAKILLAQGEKSISEIAYACGFSSQSYFTKAFRDVTKQTPGEFLKLSIIKYDTE
jgi:AraC-like DNA-binding protein